MILEKYKNFILLISIFIFSRIIYYNYFDISFDSWTIDVYWQFFPKDLLKNDLINSIIYNHYQPPLLNFIVGLSMKITDSYVIILRYLYLIIGFFSFFLIYLILKKFKFSEKFSLIITIILMIFPTTILYENHLYKEYLTFFFLILLFYKTFDEKKEYDYKDVLLISVSLSLLCLTRETFHIFWGFIFIYFIQKNLSFSKKIYLILIFTLIVSPFYLKNLILFNKFAINSATTYEHLSQKIDFIKEMKDPARHVKIRNFFFGSYENYIEFKKKGSLLYDTGLYIGAPNYRRILNYEVKSKNKLLNSDSHFSEVYFEVEKYRKKDFFLILKEQPFLILLNYINSLTRHLFSSSDYFGFTKPNADKMKSLIKVADCLKLTPICIYEYNFTKKISNIGGNSYISIDTGPLTYYEKIIYSIQHTNFLLLIIYIYLLFYLAKELFIKKNFNMMIFWLLTFFFIFIILIIFEDGEISRHRFPLDYLCFIIFLKNLKFRFLEDSKYIKK